MRAPRGCEPSAPGPGEFRHPWQRGGGEDITSLEHSQQHVIKPLT